MVVKDVQVGGDTLHVQYCGIASQPTVVLLHGFPDSLELWAAQYPVLEDAGFRVVALDLPGFGHSSLLGSQAEYAVPNLLRLVLGALDDLEVTKFHLVGHDWGAGLGWAIAQHLPERVESYVALSVGHPGGFFAEGGNKQRSLSWYMFFFVYPEAEELLAKDDWALWRLLMGPSASPGQAQASIDAMARPGRLTAGLSYYRANVDVKSFATTSIDPKQLAAGAQIRAPVMVVWSDGDAYLTEAQAKASEKFIAPGKCRYERIEGAGHWIPRDAPKELNALLLDFLRPLAAL